VNLTPRFRGSAGRIYRDFPVDDDGGGGGSTPSRGTYSSKRGNWNNIVKDSLAATYGGSASDYTWAVKEAADRWYDENNKWPTAGQLLGWGVMEQAASTAASGSAGLLPWRFNLDGVQYINDPLLGPQPVPGVDSGPSAWGQTARSFLKKLGIGAVDLTQEDVAAIFGAAPRRGGGGGGGGGAGRQAIPFDKAQLKRQGIETWRGMLLEEPDNIDALVNDYIKRANGFWTSEGGQLDFGTFIQDRARTTSRYKTLYGKKAPWQSEGQYLSQYSNAVAGFGFNQQTALREIEAGAMAGVGQAGFVTRLQQGRANFLNNQGTYSQRFAQQILQSGLAGS